MIKSGTVRLPAQDPTTGMAGTWTLSADTGDRSYVSPDIQFGGQPFANPPNVEVSLNGLEATAGVTRVRLSLQNVQVEEFNIRVTTTGDTTLTWV